MAIPNIGVPVTASAGILINAQLVSGNNDYTVTASKTWALRSLTLCNVTAVPVTVGVQAKLSGGTFRALVSNYVLPANTAGDGSNSLSLDIGQHLPAMLSDASVLRITASASTSVDVLATGTELG